MELLATGSSVFGEVTFKSAKSFFSFSDLPNRERVSERELVANRFSSVHISAQV